MIARFTFALLALAAAAACHRSTLPEPPPFVRGTVTHVAPGGDLLVEGRPGEGEYEDRASVRTGPETEVLLRSGERARLQDVAVGQEVSVWISGPVMESYPVQVFGRTVVIEPDSAVEPR